MKVYKKNKICSKKITRNDKEDTSNVIDKEIKLEKDNESNNEILDNIDNDIDTGKDSEDNFEEKKTTDSIGIKDCSDENYTRHIPVHMKLNTSRSLHNKKESER